MNKVIAHLTASHVELFYEDGTKLKNISWQNYVTELLKHVQVNVETSQRRVPFGTIYLAETLNSLHLVVYVKEHRLDYKFANDGTDEETYSIPMPNTVLEIELSQREKNWYISRAYVYATTLDPAILSSRYSRGWKFRSDGEAYGIHGGTYNLPLTNMYDNGGICYGNNSLPPVIHERDLTPCTRPLEILLTAPGNRDLPIRGVISESEFGKFTRNGKMSQFFKYWATLETFPYNNMQEY